MITIYQQERLEPQQLTQCYNLVRHLRSMYISSGMGWDRKSKFEELQLEDMRYIIVLVEDIDNGPHNGQHHETSVVELSQLTNSQCSRIYNGVIAGFASYIPHTLEAISSITTLNVTYLYEIHIAKAYRGKGIGRALMDCVRNKMLQAQSDALMLTVFNANGAALRFYYSYGFKTVAEECGLDNPQHCNCWKSESLLVSGRISLQCQCKKKGWRQLILTLE